MHLRFDAMVSIPTPPHVHFFRDWPIDLPKLPGVYAIWRGSQLVYAGMTGENWTPERPGTSHLKQRLSDHARATRANVFQSYVFERFVGRHLQAADWDELEAGRRHMNDYAREFIRAELSFSYAVARDGQEARAWEDEIRAGALGQRPLINPA